MTKTSIRNALIKAAGGAMFITQGDIKRCLGCGDDRAAMITNGLDYIRFNRTKQYDAGEVAERIYEFTEVGL